MSIHNDYRDVYNDNEDLDFQNHIINACMNNEVRVIEEYANSHDVNDYLYQGWTPLLYTSFFAQPDVIECLLTSGADPNKHRDGYTPLMALCNSKSVCIQKSLKCLRLLIQANANVNAINKHRQTSLMYACKSQEPEFVAGLLQHVKDINATDNDERTAMFYAVAANKINIVKLLLENNADLTLVDSNHYTVKDIAVEKAYDKILQLLSPDEEEVEHSHNKYIFPTWSDMFPILNVKSNAIIDSDVSAMLCGMGLDRYKTFFHNVNLKTFLQLTEDDLSDLGVDIDAQRMQFINSIHKFHERKWDVKSIGIFDDSALYTIYDNVVSLGTASKHIGVISCSFQYIKQNLLKAYNKNEFRNIQELTLYEQELKETQKNLNRIKTELLKMKTLAKKTKKDYCSGVPATYIGPKRKKFGWVMNLSIFMVVLYTSKLIWKFQNF